MTMPQSSWPLNTTGNVTLDASGNGTVQLRPDGPQEHWSLSLASFKTAQTVITNEAQCRIYIGPQVADQYFVDGSLSGSTGDSTGKVANGYDISRTGPLPSIWAVWTGGDPGAIATLSISGTASFGAGGASPFSAGEGCSNPIIGGGGALVYPSIHSPNFVTGSTGWSINKSGTAEFNSLTVRGGTIISGVFLQYSSAIPAKGNLVMSFAPIAGGTDAVGNVYPQGWNWGVWNASGALAQHFGIDTTGHLYVVDSTGTTRIFTDPSLAAHLVYDSSGIALGHLIASLSASSGTDLAGNTVKAGVTAYVPAANTWAINLGSLLSSNPALTFQNLTNALSVPAFVAAAGSTGLGAELSLNSGQATAGGSATAVSLQDSLLSGVTGGLFGVVSGQFELTRPSTSVNQISSAQAADTSTFTVTAAAFTQCSKAWSIPANDALAGTIYRLTVEGLGTQGTSQETLSFKTSSGFGLAIINQTFAGVSTAFGWKVVIEVVVLTTGAGGTANFALNCSAGAGNNGGFNHAAAFNTTIANTLELTAEWGSAAVACTMTSEHSFLERIGP